jgi:hypothetical protein
VIVLPTQARIDRLAERIERAYALRQPRWIPGCSAPGVWAAAAAALYQAHFADPAIPLDPELYVAAQAEIGPHVDPWSELAQEAAVCRYRQRIEQIIATLRRELRREVRLAGRRIARGESASTVLLTRSRSLSPLGRLIAARRAGRDDLAERLKAEAAKQHRMCPLYREASRSLLAPQHYPVGDGEMARKLDVLLKTSKRRAARN